jgi:hypothetical protein
MINRIGTALLLTSVFITGCSMSHGDPKHPKKNPHPVQRYEVIATADAPGPWDTVKGYVSFKVANLDCVPQDSFTGARNVPNTNFEFEMTRTGPKTWAGHFYRDTLQDEDLFGQGVCKWNVSTVGAEFIVHGTSFTSSDLLTTFIRHGPEAAYFKKSDFLNGASNEDEALGLASSNPLYAANPEAFFPITVIVEETRP